VPRVGIFEKLNKNTGYLGILLCKRQKIFGYISGVSRLGEALS